MADCLQAAMKAWSEAGFNSDMPPMETLHASAATIFIQACKEGLHRAPHLPAIGATAFVGGAGGPPPLDDRDAPYEDPNGELPF